MRVSILILAFLAALAAPAQVLVEGVVGDAADSSPIPDAQVLAVAGQPRAIVASATTDVQGRYHLETSEPRFELTVEALGYFVSKAGDVEAETIARVCPEESGDCAQTDFLLARAAVFDGWITDKYGNPVQSLELALTPSSEIGESPARPLIYPTQERNRNVRTASDDRGYFRLWGLRPGTYRLTSRVFWRSQIPDPPELDETVEIPAGEDSVRRSFQRAHPPPTFTISGELEGVSPGDTRWITLEPLHRGPRETVYVDQGKFTHPLPAGEYVARLEQVVNADPAEHQSDYLGKLNVTGDLSRLQLKPQPPSGVRVRLVFVECPPTPVRLQLRQKDRPNGQPRLIQFGERATEIERHGFLPGDYAVEILAQDYYLVDPPAVTVVPGQLTGVELRISNERASVRGTARFAGDAGKRQAAHITVAIRGRETRSMQTDNEGGFAFDALIPGDYEIGAWARPAIETELDEAWREAGERVQRITVEPGFEVEVDLTIAS